MTELSRTLTFFLGRHYYHLKLALLPAQPLGFFVKLGYILQQITFPRQA